MGLPLALTAFEWLENAIGGELIPLLVAVAGTVGSLLGDNLSYALGASLGRRAERRFFSSERGRGQIAWARRQLRERGPVIIVVARFVPGGRTATTFSRARWRCPGAASSSPRPWPAAPSSSAGPAIS